MQKRIRIRSAQASIAKIPTKFEHGSFAPVLIWLLVPSTSEFTPNAIVICVVTIDCYVRAHQGRRSFPHLWRVLASRRALHRDGCGTLELIDRFANSVSKHQRVGAVRDVTIQLSKVEAMRRLVKHEKSERTNALNDIARSCGAGKFFLAESLEIQECVLPAKSYCQVSAHECLWFGFVASYRPARIHYVT
jgi:hypothetical protein